ncbi:MAG TPA: hypothetical protein VD884_13805 [Ohtaekwangia sp.]|nr:hypothetical protein [Ohtaekwangia sp.]
MKKTLYSILAFILSIFLLSCEEQEKFGLAQSTKGFNYRVIPSVNSFDISQGDPQVSLTAYSDNKNIESVEIWVELNQFATKTITERSLLTTVDGNSLSSEGSVVTLSLSQFAAALDLETDDLIGGDIFNIYNIVKMDDGRIYPDTLKFTGQDLVNIENAFLTTGTTSFTTKLSFPVLCPFIMEEALGTYTVTTDDFVTYLDPEYKPVIVAGPQPNQVIIKNIFGHPENPAGQFDVIVKVDPATAVATVEKQEAWECINFFPECTFGIGSVEGQGFYFSCTGFITLDLEHTAGGSFGTYKLELTKEQ